MTDLSEIWMELDRAKSHQKTLVEDSVDFLSRRPYSIDVELNPTTGERDFLFRVNESPPEEWRFTARYLALDLRSLLDHLVHVLATVSGNDPDVTDTKPAFPAFSTFEGWTKNSARSLAGVDKRFWRTIQLLQPYQRGRVLASRDPLAQIAWMNDGDKHRRLMPRFVQLETGSAPVASFNVLAPGAPIAEISMVGGMMLNDGDVFFSARGGLGRLLYLSGTGCSHRFRPTSAHGRQTRTDHRLRRRNDHPAVGRPHLGP